MHLSDNALHNNFVTWDAELLRLILNINDNGLSPLLVLLLVELLAVELRFDALLDNIPHLGRVESLLFARLHPVSGQVRHARVSEVDHNYCLFLNLN